VIYGRNNPSLYETLTALGRVVSRPGLRCCASALRPHFRGDWDSHSIAITLHNLVEEGEVSKTGAGYGLTRSGARSLSG